MLTFLGGTCLSHMTLKVMECPHSPLREGFCDAFLLPHPWQVPCQTQIRVWHNNNTCDSVEILWQEHKIIYTHPIYVRLHLLCIHLVLAYHVYAFIFTQCNLWHIHILADALLSCLLFYFLLKNLTCMTFYLIIYDYVFPVWYHVIPPLDLGTV